MFLRFLKWKMTENGRWKMHTAWATAKCGVQVVSFFRSAHLHEHKDQMPAAAGIIKLSRENYRPLETTYAAMPERTFIMTIRPGKS